MKKDQVIGLLFLAIGIVLIYGYIGFQALKEIDIASIPIAILTGTIAIIIGVIYLFISIFFEQTGDMKKRREEIPKEDFEP